jgi:TonB family protein
MEATRLGRAWLSGRYPQAQRFDLQSASLSRVRRAPDVDFWYYQLTFYPGTPQVAGPLFVVVLPDGTVVDSTDPAAGATPSPASQVFQPGPGVTAPRLLRDVKATYTEEALRRKIGGTVLVQGVVGVDGMLRDLRIVRSLDPIYGLDSEALKAASQFVFAPGLKDGQTVPVAVTVEITFTVR